MAQGCGIGVCDLVPLVPAATPIRAVIRHPRGCPRSRYALLARAFALLGIAATLLAAADEEPSSAFVRGVAAYQRGDWGRSAAEFTAYLAQAPASNSRRDARFYLAEVQVQLRNFEDAHQHFFEYLSQIDNDPPAMVIRARFRLGETSFLLGEHQRSAQELRAFLTQHPDDALASRASDYLSRLPNDESPEFVLPEPDPPPATDPLVEIHAAIRQADHSRVIAMIDALLDTSESIDDELRLQVAAIGFRQWLALGNELRAVDTYLRGLPVDGNSPDRELQLRSEIATTLESSGHVRAAARERARCQQIELGNSNRTSRHRTAGNASPELRQDTSS